MADPGDRQWFTDDVAIHLDAVFRYFVRRAARQDADDLAAEVFAIAWRRREDVPRDGVLPWLYRTSGYVLANHRRRLQTLPAVGIDDPAAATPDLADQVARRDALSRALARLDERDRDILLLHAWEGLDGTELAAAMGISCSGAQSALSRARARLRDVWNPFVQENAAG